MGEGIGKNTLGTYTKPVPTYRKLTWHSSAVKTWAFK